MNLNDRDFARELITGIPEFEALSPLEKVSAIRRLSYTKIAQTSTAARFIQESITTEPILRRVFDRFGAGDGGVYCYGAAIILSRILTSLKFDSSVLCYGDEETFTHAVCIVEVEGRHYLHDPLFNWEYVDGAGLPLTYDAILAALLSRRPPTIRQDRDFRPIHFVQEDEIKRWIGSGRHEVISRVDTIFCRAEMTLAPFLEGYIHTDAAHDFLERRGYPRQIDYLLLFPLRVHAPSGSSSDLKVIRLLARFKRIASGEPLPEPVTVPKIAGPEELEERQPQAKGGLLRRLRR